MAEVVGIDHATGFVVGTDRLGRAFTDYLVQEEDGTSRFTLEEGGGFIILEESAAAGAGVVGIDRPLAVVVGG